METHRWTLRTKFLERRRKEISWTENIKKHKNQCEPPPMAATESTLGTPLTGDENICVCVGANACCSDELPNNPATGCWWSFGPTAEPPSEANDFDGEPPKASRIESSKSSKALFGGVGLVTTRAGDDVWDTLVLGGGGRAGGPAALPLPLLAFSPVNSACCASPDATPESSVKNGLSSFPAAACV